MKIVPFLLLFSLINGCHSQNDPNNITISYEAITRGSFLEIKITSELIEYKDNKSNKNFKLKPSDWNTLMNLIKNIDLPNMEHFIPPSDKRTVDASLHATLNITIDTKIYTSQTFDHGNPPKELKPLIDKLFDILNLE